MKIVQINMRHYEAASNDLLRFMKKESIHVTVIQEPWLIPNKVRGVRSRKYLLLSREEETPTSAIISFSTIRCSDLVYSIADKAWAVNTFKLYKSA